jgi:hypothetical protein
MGTICLSPAPNLRCVGLSLTQEVITLVPSALEAVFSLGLIFADSDAGRCVLGLRSLGCFTYSLLCRTGFDISLPQRAQSIFFWSFSAYSIASSHSSNTHFRPIKSWTLQLVRGAIHPLAFSLTQYPGVTIRCRIIYSRLSLHALSLSL